MQASWWLWPDDMVDGRLDSCPLKIVASLQVYQQVLLDQGRQGCGAGSGAAGAYLEFWRDFPCICMHFLSFNSTFRDFWSQDGYTLSYASTALRADRGVVIEAPMQILTALKITWEPKLFITFQFGFPWAVVKNGQCAGRAKHRLCPPVCRREVPGRQGHTNL